MKILVVAPHPDDETLGCGGTILKHKASGDEVYWLIMTNVFQEEGHSEANVRERQLEIEHVAKEYQFEEVFKLDFPTTQLDIIPRNKLVKAISNVISKVEPSIVYLSNRNDVHSDHKVTFDTVISSTKTFRYPFIKRVLMYEVVSETEFAPITSNNLFVPNSFSDITNYIDKKIEIMKIYKGEMAPPPFPRSKENLLALAVFRGSTAGVPYAEGFSLLKEIW